MKDVQEIYNSLLEKKQEQRDIKSVYRDVLASSAKYQEVVKKAKELREQKKRLEEEAKSESKDFKSLDMLKATIAGLEERLSDAAVAKLLKGESVKVVDERNNEYLPHVSVKFKKAGS